MDPNRLSGFGKLGAIFVVLMAGLDLYARATGQEFTLDLLNPTNVGNYIKSQAGRLNTLSGVSPTTPGAGGFNRGNVPKPAYPDLPGGSQNPNGTLSSLATGVAVS